MRIVEGRMPEERGGGRLRSAIPIALRNLARLTGLATWPPACAGALPSRPSSPRRIRHHRIAGLHEVDDCVGFLSSFIFASLVPAPVPTTLVLLSTVNLISASFSLIVIESDATADTVPF